MRHFLASAHGQREGGQIGTKNGGQLVGWTIKGKTAATHVLDEERRARNDPSMPRSMSKASASTPDIEGWNHLEGRERERETGAR